MSRVFNVSGACNPRLHYMVDIQNRLRDIRKLVDDGAYFTINRARQYGKTTTLRAMSDYLKNDYYVVFMDFQSQMSNAKFRSESIFSEAFAKAFLEKLQRTERKIPDSMAAELEALRQEIVEHREDFDLVELFRFLSRICGAADKPVVLMIDEVDSATNNQVFLDFLAQLRGYYLDREEAATFHSVILAGVYDVKNIRQKIRQDEEHKYNSPWNIAADFDVAMSLSCEGIAGMLREYEDDHDTGMDVEQMAQLLYDYTSGYPFLVSRLCKLIDEKVPVGWTKEGFLEALKILLAEKNALFESLINKLGDYPQLREVVEAMLFQGKEIPYNSLNHAIESAEMFGLVRNEHNKVVIANRIFETVLYNYLLAEEVVGSKMYDSALQDKNQFIEHGHLNMERVLEKFVETFDALYGEENESFLEDVGRKYFMLFIKPIINGTGNCYIEARTRNRKRTDMIIDYGGEQFIIELKIWRGARYHEDGEQQIAEYLDFYHLKKGYMLTYNFNQKKDIGVRKTLYGDRLLVEAVV